MRNRFALGFAAVLTVAGLEGAAAQDVTLRMGDSFPTTHQFSIEAAQYFIDRVKELSAGRIAIEYFPAQQMGKAADMLRLLQTGVLDIAYVGPAYVSERMPLSEVHNLAGLFDDACDGTNAYLSLAESYAPLKAEFEGNGIRLLFATSAAPFQLAGAHTEITSLSDFQGKKIRSSGPSADMVIEALGGVPVTIPAPEILEALSRGTIDFNLGTLSSYKAYGLYEVAHYSTRNLSFGNFIVTYSISDAAWAKLSDTDRAVLTEAAGLTNKHTCAFVEQDYDKVLAEMEAAGTKFTVFAPDSEAQKQAEQIFQASQAAWAKSLDDRGLPGTQTVAAFKDALKAVAE